MSMGIRPKRLVGVWDLGISKIFLGGLITLAEELLIVAERNRISAPIDIYIVGDRKKIVPQDAFLAALASIKGIRKIIWSNTLSLPEDSIRWPASQRYAYGSTLAVQQFYKEKKSLPYLSMKETNNSWARSFFKHRIGDRLPIVIHLKNANMTGWRKLFSLYSKEQRYIFILIGNDPLPQTLRQHGNVIVARDFGSTLPRDLALITHAYLFLGLASGPCNMAIFSDVPYVIFKDPRQHPESMKREIGRQERFSFSKPYQFFLRKYDTFDTLRSSVRRCITLI